MSTDKRTIDWYNSNAERYTQHVQDPNDSIYHAYYEKPAMYDLLPKISGKTVVTLGCGPGEDTEYLRQQGASRSVGIDISDRLIGIAKTNHPECEFEIMDMEALNFADASFDFAYSSLALSYVKDWATMLAEICRVLKPGSSFLFSCEHPVASGMKVTKSDKGTKLSLVVESDRIEKTIRAEGNYMQQHISGYGISDDVTTWHRPMGQLLNDVISAGFILEKVVEPLPRPEMKKIKPTTYEKLNIVPEFIIVKCKKA